MINLEKLKNLREQILDLAIRGKLVKQIADEGTAEELFSQIQDEKIKLISEGKLKKEKPLPEITEDEIPFEIPKSWKWVRLGNIVTYAGKQVQPEYIKETDWILDLEDIESYTGKLLRRKEFCKIKSNKFQFKKGNILYGKMRPYLNKVIIADSNGYCSTEIIPLDFDQFNLNNQFFKYVFNSRYFIEYAVTNSKGVNIPRLGTIEAKKALIPLPPLAEQKRIVDKIEKHFSVIDKAEEQLNKKIALNEKIREKVLQMAIQGKLVEQRADEGTAEELFSQIQDEKIKLISEGKLKKEKPLPEIKEDEIPFEIPKSWKWARLSNIVDIRDGTHNSPKYQQTGIPLITSKNLSEGKLSFDNVKYISIEDAIEINKRSLVENGDILFAMIGTIGNPVLVKKNRDFCIKNLALFKNIYSINVNFIYWYLSYVQNKLETTGGLQPFISLKMFRGALFPLPPLAEQKRIVEKVESIFSKLDS